MSVERFTVTSSRKVSEPDYGERQKTYACSKWRIGFLSS
jgi:hypothetical protein